MALTNGWSHVVPIMGLSWVTSFFENFIFKVTKDTGVGLIEWKDGRKRSGQRRRVSLWERVCSFLFQNTRWMCCVIPRHLQPSYFTWGPFWRFLWHRDESTLPLTHYFFKCGKSIAFADIFGIFFKEHLSFMWGLVISNCSLPGEKLLREYFTVDDTSLTRVKMCC